MSDPGIILEAGNIKGPDPNNLISMFSLAQQVQQAKQETAKKNALLQAFSDPNSVDPATGTPTPQAIRKVMSVDPEMGLKLQDDALGAQVKRAQAAHYQTEAGKNNFDFMSSAAGIGYDAYDDAKKSGKSEPEAVAAGQAARNEAVKNNGGVIGDDLADSITGKPFDPAGAKALAGSNKEWLSARTEQMREKHDEVLEDIAATNAGMALPSRGGATPPASGGDSASADPYTAFAAKMDKSENSTGNPGAKNPLSSATGNGQFTNSTWLQTAKADHPEWVKAGLTDDQIKVLRADPKTSLDATASLAKKNAQALSADGIPVTGTTLALAHRFGAEDAPKIYHADPATPIASIVSPEVMKANPNLAGQTAGQVVGALTTQFGSAPVGESKASADVVPAKVNLGKGAVAMKDSDGTDYYVNPSRPGIAADVNGMPYTPKGGGAKLGSTASGAEFTPAMGALMAATAEQGVSLPTGFRSKAQQVELYQGLLDRNPDKSPDQIATMLKSGQIEFGAQKKETQTAANIAGKVQVFANELDKNLPLLRAASKDVPRGSWMDLTKLLQTADTHISDPKLKTLKGYINSTLQAYDGLGSRGGMDKDKREANRKLLLSADGPEAFEAQLKVFENEAKIAKESAYEATKSPELEDKSGAKDGGGVKKVDHSKMSDADLKKLLGIP